MSTCSIGALIMAEKLDSTKVLSSMMTCRVHKSDHAARSTHEPPHRDDRDAGYEPPSAPSPTPPAGVSVGGGGGPGADLAGGRCRSRQRNTHSTESREVRYPWHPWCGRSVTVYEALTKGGQPVCRGGVDDQRHGRCC